MRTGSMGHGRGKVFFRISQHIQDWLMEEYAKAVWKVQTMNTAHNHMQTSCVHVMVCSVDGHVFWLKATGFPDSVLRSMAEELVKDWSGDDFEREREDHDVSCDAVH